MSATSKSMLFVASLALALCLRVTDATNSPSTTAAFVVGTGGGSTTCPAPGLCGNTGAIYEVLPNVPVVALFNDPAPKEAIVTGLTVTVGGVFVCSPGAPTWTVSVNGAQIGAAKVGGSAGAVCTCGSCDSISFTLSGSGDLAGYTHSGSNTVSIATSTPNTGLFVAAVSVVVTYDSTCRLASQTCSASATCCNNAQFGQWCSGGVCVQTSSVTCASQGQKCTTAKDCCANLSVCNVMTGCQPTSGCGAPNAACTAGTPCCSGYSCSGGLCKSTASLTCSAKGQACKSNTDCCSPLQCDAVAGCL